MRSDKKLLSILKKRDLSIRGIAQEFNINKSEAEKYKWLISRYIVSDTFM